MHRHCLSCSADLGENQVVEAFPLGRRLAFDAWRGRLWLVCPRCRRWNLAPIEERWEPVEALEQLFRDARLRVHSENIGLARLADGTTLIRVGQALEGELAAWRYGSELRRRRWKGVAAGVSLGVAAGGLALGGLTGLIALGIPAGMGNVVFQSIVHVGNLRRRRRVICRLEPGESPTGQPLLVRGMHLDGAVLAHDDAGAPLLWAPALTAVDYGHGWVRSFGPDPMQIWRLVRDPPCALHGETAVRAITRAMVQTNRMGGTSVQIVEALHLLEAAGGAEAFIRKMAGREPLLATKPGQWQRRRSAYAVPDFRERRMAEDLPPAVRKHALTRNPLDALGRIEALALEMALHDERERRAMEGELAALEEEWREAEVLAGIADALPDEPRDANG
jgi:hypothetical protein